MVKVCDGRPVFGWLFDLDPENGHFYRAPETPYVTGGTYTFDDSPIGDDGDDGKSYFVVLVAADEACNKTLVDTKPNSDGDYVFNQLPQGCTEVQRVELVVTF